MMIMTMFHPTTLAVLSTLVCSVISTPEAIHVPSDEQYEQPEQLDGTKTFSSLGFLDLQDNSYDYQAYDGGPGNTPAAYILESSAPIGSQDKRIVIDPSPTKIHDEVVIVDETIEEPTKKIKSALRKKASQSYKERLKNRYETAKLYEQSNEQTESPSTDTTRVPRYKSRSRSFKRFRYNKDDEDDDIFEEAEADEGRQGRALTDFGSRSSRQTRPRSSFRRNTSRGSSSSESSFSSRRSSGFSSRNRFKSRHESDDSSHSDDHSSVSSLRKPAPKKSFSSRKQETVETSTNPVVIKKFNRFDRPDYRKTLLNKLFQKRPDIKSRIEANREKAEEEEREADLAVGDDDDVDREAQPSALALSVIDDEDILQNIDNEEIKLERLLTTLQVSTLYPQELSSEFIELATIRSPYTFNIEEDSKSTRFITITKSFTKTKDISPSTTFTSSPSSTVLAHTPLFDINSIPAPENILASSSSHHDDDHTSILGSSNIEYLSPVTITSSLPTPPLKTVTETMSTVDTTIKKSILPVIYGDQSSLFTLTQTYSVTKIVTAVKTLPPAELLGVNPIESFAEFDNLFEEAGSERRESLLPGELEFSDQDNYGLEGPSVVKVAPPSDFNSDDFGLVSSKFDHQSSHDEAGATPALQSPGSGAEGLAALGITPEQLLYLQLLQNPWAAALGAGAFNRPQVITESSPVITTKPVIETSVLKVTFGAREILTTIVETKGVTTSTDYILATKTVENGGFGGITDALGALGGLQAGAADVQAQNPFAGLVPSFTLVSTPVTRDTVLTETVTEEFKIRFRNQETFTTITSTSLLTTQVTSFITKTQRVLPTANPFAGLLG